MAKKYVHREGRVCRVFETPFSDWNQVPEAEFPQTVIAEDDAHLRAQVGDCVIIDRPQPAAVAPSTPSGLPIGAIINALAGMDMPQAVKDSLIARQSKNKEASEDIVVKVATVVAEVDYQNKMLQEFRLVLASIGNAYSREEAEAIGNFILAVDSSLESELVKAKLAQTNRRFTL